jgi:FtsH-binding integral membrane protein
METIKTYRYVRLAMVGLVVAILAAMLIAESRSAGGFEGSVSYYYYTPARGVFAAALLAIGVCLICVRGGNTLEDVLLNVAGMLAPVVALVPTPPSDGDPNLAALVADREAAVRNNFPALLLVGVFAALVLVLLLVLAYVKNEEKPSRWDLLGFVLAMAVVLAAYLWYRCDQDSFFTGAHFTAAIGMFVCIAITAIADGLLAMREQGKKTRGRFYIAIGAGMLVIGGGIIGYNELIHPWKHAVLQAELVLILLFAVFWAMQTADLWNHTSRKEAIAHEAAQAALAAG